MAESQQQQWISIGKPGDGAPVKTVKWHAMSRCGGDDADPGTPMNEAAGCQPVVHRFVGRAQPTWMPNGDHATACDHA